MDLLSLVKGINSYLWGVPMIVALVGAGVLFSIKLGFPQVFRLKEAFKTTFGDMFCKEDCSEGSMTSFQSLATAIAAQVGTGNVAGVATAIMAGGPGAIFWMWFAAFFGMGTIQIEALLAQKYRECRDGQLVGGPAYYLKNGFAEKGKPKLGKFLAGFFAIAIILALGFIGNMVQSNSIAEAMNTAFGINKLYLGFGLAVLAALVFFGGMGRIAKFAELVVPVMAVIYILGSVMILIKFRIAIIPTFISIFTSAFSAKAAAGGMMGASVKMAIRYGVSRGLFSNEAGMGSTPNSHAVAEVDHPAKQGMVAMIGVFISTVLICTATALCVLVTEANLLQLDGPAVTQEAFRIGFGDLGIKFLAICLTFFAFTTIVGWYYFGETNVRHLCNKKIAVRIYQVIVLGFIVLGAAQRVDLVWELADMFNGIMVIPNLIGLFYLNNEAVKIYKDYQNQIKSNDKLHYDYKYQCASK